MTSDRSPDAGPYRFTESPEGTGRAFVQVDTWRENGTQYLMMIAQRMGEAHAMMVLYEPGHRLWEAGSANIRMDVASHDARYVADLIKVGGASRTDMADLGMFDGHVRLASRLVALAIPKLDPGPARWDDAPTWQVGHPQQMAGRMLRGRADRRSPQPATFGYTVPDRQSFAFTSGGSFAILDPRDLPAPSEVPLTQSTVIRTDDASPDDAKALAARLEAVLAKALSDMGTPECREAFAILTRENWSNDGHRHIARAGRIGLRRRQAAKLYPAFAPMLRRFGDVEDLVDSARPFEQALLGHLREMAGPAVADGFTVAAMRKLRTLEPCPFKDLATSVEIAASLPVDWLPRNQVDWHEAQQHLGGLLPYAGILGISLKGVLSHAGGNLDRLSEGLPPRTGISESGEILVIEPVTHATDEPLRYALDVAKRLAKTLVGQVRNSMGIGAHVTDEGPTDVQVAGAILYEGRSPGAIHKHQRRWHTGLSVLEAALPPHEAGNAWPAAFEPYGAPNGLHVVCMVTEAELKADGAVGPDADGIDGLAHCIGGYGLECYTGESICASVRRPTADGFVRLSSVELEASAYAEGLELVQHQGYDNEPPCNEAHEAVASLLEDLKNGVHPLSETADERRTSDGFLDSYRWDTPGAMEQAFEAWRIHLPREIAKAGFGAFKERVAREVGRLVPHVEPERPLTVVHVDREAGGPYNGFLSYPGP